jgi:short-subunit dehydrogenase
LVSGASRGIGLALARLAQSRGAKLGLVARSEADLENACSTLGARALSCDVSRRDEVERAVGELEAQLGPVDILVNNAGAGLYRAFVDTDVGEFERLMRVNYFGALYLMKTVLPGMCARRRGHIVNVASVSGRIGTPFESAYAASKFALVGLTESLAVEANPFGVQLSCVNPGPVATNFFDARGAAYQRAFPRPIAADAVAAAIVDAIEKERAEVFVPAWLGMAHKMKTLSATLYRLGVKRDYEKDVAELTRRRWY